MDDLWTERLTKRTRELREASREERLRMFAYGLMYDVLRWTPPDTTADQRKVLEDCLALIESLSEVLPEDLRTIRERLKHSGWRTMPEPDEE